MNWVDRILISLFMGGFMTLAYLIFFDQQKKSLDLQRINSKLILIQDLAKDLDDLAKNINAKNAVANIQFDNSADIFLMEKTFKMALVSDVISSKAQMMKTAVDDAMKELKTKKKFCETL